MEDSIEIVLSDWTNEKLIKNKIAEKICNEGSIIVKGYLIFNSKDLVAFFPFATIKNMMVLNCYENELGT
ncbi:hypothetical protein [Bacillus tuaregi]|uniref:hypothetical protein n=1 Tax=Bacillus tuaregi TaxID=1816695 RepID=UPI0008F7FF56|nr:hypothetical protein [Bacillus tuaregi]